MALPPPDVVLNPATPDYDNILTQFETMLALEKSWNNILTSGTGSTLLRFISSAISLEIQAIERAQQETILDTARLGSSIFRISRMLGVHLQRRNPANIQVNVTRTSSSGVYTIPAYSTWTLSGQSLFNKEGITFTNGQSLKTVHLYLGTVRTVSFTSDGSGFQEYAFGPTDYSISDQDLVAVIDNEQWQFTTMGLWRYTPTDKVFYQNTLPNGQVAILFGNNIYGKIPPLGSSIDVTYVSVPAISDQNVITGTVIDSPNSEIVTTSVSGISGYQAHLSPSFYKIMSPALFASQERAVTRMDHRALTLQYPGVIDCVWLGQKEINPGDLRWMNVIQACLLTDATWTTSQWNAFKSWYQNQVGMAALEVVRKDPTPITVNYTLKIYCFNRAKLTSVQTQATTLIQGLFTKQLGSLGSSYHDSDISTLLKENIVDKDGSLVDYVDISLPAEPITLKNTQYAVLGNLNTSVNYSDRGETKILTTIN